MSLCHVCGEPIVAPHDVCALREPMQVSAPVRVPPSSSWGETICAAIILLVVLAALTNYR